LPDKALKETSLQLWFTQLEARPAECEETIRSLLSDSELQRLKSTRNINKQREFLLSRALMRQALSHHFQLPQSHWRFTEKPNSLPDIEPLPPGCYLSLSHSKGLICFAISSTPVGIDIEYAGKNRDFCELAQTVMTREEIVRLDKSGEQEADMFYRIWSAKEAYYKALPVTGQSTFKFKDFSVLTLAEQCSHWKLIEGKAGNYRLAIVTRQVPELIQYRLPSSDNNLELELTLSDNRPLAVTYI